MAKTKFFRVAVAGATVDGRVIEPEMIQQMADTYNRDTYTARINCEHLRGFSPAAPFNSYGSIDALKAEAIDIEIGGKTEKRLALFASFDVNDQAKSINKDGQKLFSSVEINPNFADSKKAYLMGLALTDSPASLGTELLKFSRDEAKKDNLLAFDELPEIEFEEDTAASEAKGAFSAVREFFENLNKPKTEAAPPPAVQPAAAPEAQGQADQFAAFSAAVLEGFGKIESAFKAANDATEAKLAKVTQDLSKLTSDIEKTKPQNYTPRPPAGGGEALKAEF